MIQQAAFVYADGKIQGARTHTHTHTHTLTCGLNPGLHNEKSVINLRLLFLLVIACNPKDLLLNYIFLLLPDCCRNRETSGWIVDDRTESTVKPRCSATICFTTICGVIKYCCKSKYGTTRNLHSQTSIDAKWGRRYTAGRGWGVGGGAQCRDLLELHLGFEKW
jgi:hypothetical protein